MAKRKSHRARGRRRATSQQRKGDEAYDVGVVLVHGIGPTKPGRTLARWSPSIESALGGLCVADAVNVCEGTLDVAGSTVPTRALVIERSGRTARTVLVAEACWSDVYRPRTLVGTLPWLVRVLPALVLPFLPDRRDEGAAAPNGIAVLMMMLRILMRVAAVAAVIAFVMWLPAPLQLVISFVVALVVGVSLVSRRANLAGHVRMAATDDPGLAAVEDHIARIIATCQQSASKVVVVAHSQGGYLAYRVIRRDQLRVSLVCVGSGLRPITLLRAVGERPYNWAVPVVLIGLAAMVVAFVAHFDPGDAYPANFREVALSSYFASTFSRMPTLRGQDLRIADLFDTLPRMRTSWSLAVAACAYLISAIVARRMGPGFLDRCRIAPLPVTRWVDLTSRQDMVGRLTVPTLPARAVEKPVVLAGNPIADHVLYFRKDSISVWLIAAEITRALGLALPSQIETARQVALARSDRRHRLRLASVGVPLLAIAAIGAMLNQHWRLSDLIPFAPAAATLILVSGPVIVGFEWWDSRRIVLGLPGKVPPMPKATSARRGLVSATLLMSAGLGNLMAWVLLLLVLGDRAFAAIGWVHWSTAILQLALAAMVISGYRPGSKLVVGIAVWLGVCLASEVQFRNVWAPLMGNPVPPGFWLWTSTLLLTTLALAAVWDWPGRAGLGLRRTIGALPHGVGR